MTYILGISCFYHDAAAALTVDGEIMAAAQEERFTRKKHDPGFPSHAVRYCLQEAGIGVDDLAHVVFYDKPFLTFERLLLSYLTVAPRGLRSWLQSMPLWLGQKIHVPKVIQKEIGYEGEVLYTEHHEAHAASAFYPSPFETSAILTVDGVGEWATASYGFGKGRELTLLKELHFPDSVGLLYSAFTYFTGFKVNSGEYKLMGLAPYGEPVYKNLILDKLIDLKEDGSIRLNLSYFDFLGGLRMTNRKFARLFGGPARRPETDITKREMDIAASIQAVTEEIVMKMAGHVYRETRLKTLCLAGGVALNCVANGLILKNGPFDHIWIQPAAGDAGGALGAALSVWHRYLEMDRPGPFGGDRQRGSYLGPAFSNAHVEAFLRDNAYPFRKLNPQGRAGDIAGQIAEGKIVGYLAGRMEFGPRALGARSILGDPRSSEIQRVMNLKIKFRESFRPFAPSVLEDKSGAYFDLDGASPYMLLTAPVREERRLPQPQGGDRGMLALLNVKRSDIPAVTHLDYSARIQTVGRTDKPDYYDVIRAFESLTGCAVVVNTSFNVRGEPIVCTVEDAYRCFMRTDMDVLVVEDCMLFKEGQPAWKERDDWRDELILD
ncbi:MAG: carbamoyltransferase [Deltaproteobacteria bacterium]|nr:carbamoyltransferase [Deltaproteobacteria bacterium]MBW1819723.1 carbamoyltransferase [Deltaproteobacteria bacterium]MBW2283864.1 carbamoyltransferase [Deltaproteobacteria bacterium]